MELPNPISLTVEQPRIIPWEEQLQDHNLKIEEYLQNLLFRGCMYETTVTTAKVILKRLFNGLQIEDPNHPRGCRQILVWELLNPERSSSRLGLLTSFLLHEKLAHGTRREYIRELRAFCDYVLAKPNIPGSSELTIIDKYGPIALTFTKYDLPVHAQDRPTKPRYALSTEVRDEFYEFLRTEHAHARLGFRTDTVEAWLDQGLGGQRGKARIRRHAGRRRLAVAQGDLADLEQQQGDEMAEEGMTAGK